MYAYKLVRAYGCGGPGESEIALSEKLLDREEVREVWEEALRIPKVSNKTVKYEYAPQWNKEFVGSREEFEAAYKAWEKKMEVLNEEGRRDDAENKRLYQEFMVKHGLPTIEMKYGWIETMDVMHDFGCRCMGGYADEYEDEVREVSIIEREGIRYLYVNGTDVKSLFTGAEKAWVTACAAKEAEEAELREFSELASEDVAKLSYEEYSTYFAKRNKWLELMGLDDSDIEDEDLGSDGRSTRGTAVRIRRAVRPFRRAATDRDVFIGKWLGDKGVYTIK